jgi:hypothetical protein
MPSPVWLFISLEDSFVKWDLMTGHPVVREVKVHAMHVANQFGTEIRSLAHQRQLV